MRRLLVLVSAMLALVMGGLAPVAAQEAENGAALRDLGYPELVVTVTDAGIEVPPDVEAGRLLVTAENAGEGFIALVFAQLPEGVTVADLEEAFAPPATPEDDAEAEGPPEEEIPDWLYEMTWAGGVELVPGGQSQVVLSLTPGEWVVFNLFADPEFPLAPATLTVVGDAVATDDEAVADAIVDMDEFQIILPERIEAGQQIWHVTNSFEQPHEIFILQSPEPITVEQAQQILELEFAGPDAELPEGLPDPDEFMDVGFVMPISQAQSVLVEFNLEPGTYLALCFIPDQETGMPHAALGMYVVFTVGAEGEDVPPPASPEPEEHNSHD